MHDPYPIAVFRRRIFIKDFTAFYIELGSLTTLVKFQRVGKTLNRLLPGSVFPFKVTQTISLAK